MSNERSKLVRALYAAAAVGIVISTVLCVYRLYRCEVLGWDMVDINAMGRFDDNYRDAGRFILRSSRAALHACMGFGIVGLVLLRIAWLMEPRNDEPRE